MGLFDFGNKVKKAQRAAENKNKKTLLRLMKDEQYSVQIAAIRGLGQIGDPGAAEHLIPLLKDPEFEVRAAAAESLGILGGDEARRALLDRLAEEKNDYARQTMRSAAAKIR